MISPTPSEQSPLTRSLKRTKICAQKKKTHFKKNSSQENLNANRLQIAKYNDNNLELWMHDYGDYLYSYAMSRLNDKHSSEDVVQDTFLAAWKSFNNFEQRCSMKTWLTIILCNKIVDASRKKTRQIPIITNEWGGHSSPATPDNIENISYSNHLNSWALLPDDQAQRGDFWKALQASIKRLPPNMAEVFTLLEFKGLTTKEICKLKQISDRNFWVLLHRARKQLRDLMLKECIG